jgi:hypothetical protein
MTRERFLEAVTEGMPEPDALQMADHLTEMYWPDADWFKASHVLFLSGELQAMYRRWNGHSAPSPVERRHEL